MISLIDTGIIVWLGISIPTVLLPGIGASILTSFADNSSAISLDILSTLFTLVPLCSSISYWVTAGPTCISITLATIPKSLNTLSSFLVFAAITSVELTLPLDLGILSKFIDGFT